MRTLHSARLTPQREPHWIKALFQGSSRPGWIQPNSVLASKATLEPLDLTPLAHQLTFVEAAQDLEEALGKENPLIRTQGTNFSPGTTATVSKAELQEILDTIWKVESALEAARKTSLDKVRASVHDCLISVLEAI